MPSPRHPGFPAAFVFAGLLLAHLAFAQAPEPPATRIPDGAYRIAGTVVDARTGNPLTHARVAVADARNLQRTQSFISAGDGRFEFHVPAGKFALQAEKRGYILSSYDQHDQFSTAIVTGAGVDTESLVLRVIPSAVLTGKVLDENGDPVRETLVSLYKEDRFSGVSQIRRVRSAQTDDEGRYEAPNLDPGTYFVSVQAHPWYAVHPASSGKGDASPAGQVDSALDVAYPVTYYGDVADAESATPIPVRGGDRLEADIHLNPLPALHLLFHVADNGERGVNVPELEQPAFDEMEGVSNRGVQQVSPGVYEITGVPAGRYMVRMPDADGQMQAPMAVDLASSQELTGSSGSSTGSVKLKVQVAGAASPPPRIQIGLRNSKGHVISQVVDEKGGAEFGDLFAGKYDVMAGSPDEVYSVVAMKTDNGPIAGRTLNLPSGASLTVSITLAGGSVRVDGFAKRAGKAAPGAMIVLVPKNPKANNDRFRRDQSDLDGSFTFFDVSPGSYTVIAIEDGWELDWAKPAVLARYSSHGQPLIVDSQIRGTHHLPGPVEVEPR